MSGLSPNTKVNLTIGAVATAVGGIIYAAVWTANLVNDIRGQLFDLSRQITDYKTDNYTRSNAAEVTLRNAILNPGTSWADPRDPTKTIYVDPSRWAKSAKE